MINLEFILKKTAVVITAFNPDIVKLRNNILSYVMDVELVVLCDNSDNKQKQDEVHSLVTEFESLALVSMNGNKGIAAAQNRGVSLAIDKGFEYFIEMDQDSCLPPKYIYNIASSYFTLINDNKNVAGIGPLAMRETDGFIYYGYHVADEVVEVEKTLSSAFFYSRAAFDLVGPKDEGLFIDLVDWEWCWRAKPFGLSVFLDKKLVIRHMLGSGHRKTLIGEIGLPTPIRHYYQYRNGLYMLGKSYVPIKWKLKRVIILFVKFPFYLMSSDKGGLRFKYIMKGIFDFIRGKSGRINSD